MIHEYALEPELVATCTSIQEVRFYVREFGLGTPRIIARYPSKWDGKVWRAVAANLTTMERKRLEALIAHLSYKMTRRGQSPVQYDGTRPWIENALDEHAHRPFAAILARSYAGPCAEVLTGDAIGDDQNGRWKCETGACVSRDPSEFVRVLTPLLRSCGGRVVIVDPHFAAQERRYSEMFLELANALVAASAEASNISFVIHTKDDEKKPTKEVILAACESQIAPNLPSTVTVEIVRWQERQPGERLHDRFILTPVGGIIVGDGFDRGGPEQSTDFNVLSRDQFELRWAQFEGPNFAFDDADGDPSQHIKITGQRRR